MMCLSMEQIEEALGELNHYYTLQALGREPSALECIKHYAEHRRIFFYQQVDDEEVQGVA